MIDGDDPKIRRELERAAKVRQKAADDVIVELMGRRNGRAWICDLLERCHCFHSSFKPDPYSTAYLEGERSIGLQLLESIHRAAPDQYIQMMRERNARDLADASRLEQLSDEPEYGPGHPDYPTDDQLASYNAGSLVTPSSNGRRRHDDYGVDS